MKLLVDAGNRRLKWALSGAGEAPTAAPNMAADGARGAIDIGEIDDALAKQWAAIGRPDSVWAACVAGAEVQRTIETCARRAWDLPVVFIAAQPRQAGVVNSYAQPAALGGDRWAALVAARHLLPRRAVIVVDAGSAVTVDALDAGGQFRGGVILPGVFAMRAALAKLTANLGGASAAELATPPRLTALATDTDSAVINGAWLALAGGIDAAIVRQRAALASDCRALLTGGDAEKIAPLLAAAGLEPAPDLALRGLAIIAGLAAEAEAAS